MTILGEPKAAPGEIHHRRGDVGTTRGIIAPDATGLREDMVPIAERATGAAAGGTEAGVAVQRSLADKDVTQDLRKVMPVAAPKAVGTIKVAATSRVVGVNKAGEETMAGVAMMIKIIKAVTTVGARVGKVYEDGKRTEVDTSFRLP